jgi:teichuronic acid biosynthesis glycosyltransferase TuaC
MRVLTVTPLFPGAAAPAEGVFIKERQRHLPAGVHVTVSRWRPWFPFVALVKPHLRAKHPRREIVGGLEVFDCRFPYVPGFWKSADGDFLGRALRRFAKTHAAFDLFDAHFTHPAGAGAVIAARGLGLPVVVTERGTIGSYAQDGRRAKMAAALRGATRLIAVSSSLAEIMREVAGRDLDVRVIPNGIDRAVFSPGDRIAARAKLGLADRGPVLLTVGGLVPRKGVARVLEILPELRARHPDLVYVVAGGGGAEGDHETAIRRAIAERGLGGCVRLAGAIAHEDLAAYYRAADVFVLSTQNEGWANVLQEALACGTPVVTTDVGGNRELVAGERHGLIVPFGDPRALRAAVADALAHRWDHRAIAEHGGRRDWRTVGEEVRAVYDEALNARR